MTPGAGRLGVAGRGRLLLVADHLPHLRHRLDRGVVPQHRQQVEENLLVVGDAGEAQRDLHRRALIGWLGGEKRRAQPGHFLRCRFYGGCGFPGRVSGGFLLNLDERQRCRVAHVYPSRSPPLDSLFSGPHTAHSAARTPLVPAHVHAAARA
jgi:hypothetical protein